MDEHHRKLIRNIEGKLEDAQRVQREFSRASDADRPLNRYDTQSLMADAQAVLAGIDYPIGGNF